MTDNAGTELYIPARNGFDSDNTKHRRNMRAIEEWTKSPFVTKAKIGDAVIENAHIEDATIESAKIKDLSADKITAGTLTAAVVMAGILQTATEGQRWEIDEAGIRAYNADEEQTVNIPAATGDITIKGFIEALGLTVLGNLTLSGTDNKISEGAVITMSGGSGGTDPALGPQLSSTYTKLPLAGVSSGIGLWYDSTNTSYWTTQGVRFSEHDDTTGAEIRSKDVSGVSVLYGICRVGTRVYVLCQENDGIKLKVFSESSLTYINQRNLGTFVGTILGRPVIGDDGTNVIVAFIGPTGSVQFSKWTRADLPVYVSTTASSGGGNPTATILDFVDGLSGFAVAESKWWVQFASTSSPGLSGLDVEAYSTAGVYDADEGFPSGRRGLAEGPGSVFASFDGQSVWTHTEWVWTTESPIYWVRYTWVDMTNRPLGAGEYESVRSPVNSITHKKRSTLQITSAEVPGGVTHVGMYVDRGAAEPTLDYVVDIAATTGVAAVANLTSFTAGGAAPPTTSTFPGGSGTESEFRSEDGSVLWRSNGIPKCILEYTAGGTLTNNTDMYIRFGTESSDTDAFHSATTDALSAAPGAPTNAYDVALPFTGAYLVTFSVSIGADAANSRQLGIDHNGSIYRRMTFVPTAGIFRISVPETIVATAGDLLRFFVLQNSGGGLALNNARVAVFYQGPT